MSAPADSNNPEQLSSDDVGTALVNGATFMHRPLQYAAVGGRCIFEGDIDLGSVAEVEALNALARSGIFAGAAVIIPDGAFRWPGGHVPYEIDAALPNRQRVTDAMAHWEEHTVIRFVHRNPENALSHPNYVRFFPGPGCSSKIGMQGGEQNISLHEDCGTGSAIHEIGHAVGLWHEQSREDRDSFVRINWQNIELGKEHNFNQHISDGDDVGRYDYTSIMHYGRDYFGIDGAETITPLDPAAQIGNRDTLSAGDIAAVASMYGAAPAIPKKVRDDPVNFKKNQDDAYLHKQLRDAIAFPKVFALPRPPGDVVSPFLLSTEHHADVDSDPSPDAGLQAAAAAVDEHQRSVIALQSALSVATANLTRAQDLYFDMTARRDSPE